MHQSLALLPLMLTKHNILHNLHNLSVHERHDDVVNLFGGVLGSQMSLTPNCHDHCPALLAVCQLHILTSISDPQAHGRPKKLDAGLVRHLHQQASHGSFAVYGKELPCARRSLKQKVTSKKTFTNAFHQHQGTCTQLHCWRGGAPVSCCFLMQAALKSPMAQTQPSHPQLSLYLAGFGL